jgi:cytoskeletal protein RodZ
VELVFAARGPGPFQLALGRGAARAVAIDRSVLIPGYVDGTEFELPAVGLGAVVVRPEVSPTWKEALTQAGPEQRRRWVLWGVLAAAVVVLALLALRLARDLGGGQPPAAGG